MKIFITIFLMSMLLIACKSKDDPANPVNPVPDPLPAGLIIQISDTVIVVPDSAIAFARNNFVPDAYLLREYQVATSQRYSTNPFEGTIEQWKLLAWEERIQYLFPPYNYCLNAADSAHFYELIGRRDYFMQFGYGWKDTYPLNSDLTNPNGNIWSYPSDTTLVPDNPNTMAFDGSSSLWQKYRSMWIVIP